MSGYRDTDDMILSCGQWDSIFEKVETLQSDMSDVLKHFGILTKRQTVLEDMFKQMCDALRECGVEGLPTKPCQHEWHADQDAGANRCRHCGILQQ